MTRTLFFFGTHPELSFAELSTVCPILLASPFTLHNHHTYAILESEHAIDADRFMNRLGGTIKIAERLEITEDTLDEWVLNTLPKTAKNVFGISLYSEQSSRDRLSSVRRIGMSIKRALQSEERSVRFVQSQDPTLSAVIVTKEHLIASGIDLCIIREKNNTLFARTVAVQPFEAFSERDYGRPGRDSKSGMLPPKLARMMVNLASATEESSLLDPFCGSGTVLQEALLIGVQRAYGSDISEKAVADTMHNLEWLKLRAQEVLCIDAQKLSSSPLADNAPFDCIVFEGYLGTPKPYERDIPEIKHDLTTLYTTVFTELNAVMGRSSVIVAALPFWLLPEFDERLPIERIIERAGLRLQRKPLYYFRPSARVGREIIVLKKA